MISLLKGTLPFNTILKAASLTLLLKKYPMKQAFHRANYDYQLARGQKKPIQLSISFQLKPKQVQLDKQNPIYFLSLN